MMFLLDLIELMEQFVVEGGDGTGWLLSMFILDIIIHVYSNYNNILIVILEVSNWKMLTKLKTTVHIFPNNISAVFNGLYRQFSMAPYVLLQINLKLG
jgi:hypothetical protein